MDTGIWGVGHQAECGATAGYGRFVRMWMLAVLLALGVGLTSTGAWAEAPSSAAMVNINTAAAEELSAGLSGVGLAKARRIIEYREMHGPFEFIDELAEVRGIGTSIVDRNRARIVLQ